MRTLIAAREGELLTALMQAVPGHQGMHAVETKDAFHEALREPFERIVLDLELMSGVYPWEWIEAIRSAQPAAEVAIIPSEAAYDSLWLEVAERLCTEAGFSLLPLGMPPEEAALRAIRGGEADPAAPGDKRGIAAAVWAASCKDGATTVALNAALTIARQRPDVSVGLLDLNLKNPELRLFLRGADASRTNVPLRPKLQTGAVGAEELALACASVRKLPNLRILYGSRRRDTACDVSAEMMQTLLAAAREAFDITIMDLSTFPDNAATVCGVRGADVRWLVAGCGNPSYLWNWSEWFECYWKLCGLKPEDVELVLNRWDGTGEHPEKAAHRLGIRFAGAVPAVPATAALRACEEGRPFIELPQAGEFAAGIHRLAGRLAEAAGCGHWPELVPARRRPSLVSLLSGLF